MPRASRIAPAAPPSRPCAGGELREAAALTGAAAVVASLASGGVRGGPSRIAASASSSTLPTGVVAELVAVDGGRVRCCAALVDTRSPAFVAVETADSALRVLPGCCCAAALDTAVIRGDSAKGLRLPAAAVAGAVCLSGCGVSVVATGHLAPDTVRTRPHPFFSGTLSPAEVQQTSLLVVDALQALTCSQLANIEANSQPWPGQEDEGL